MEEEAITPQTLKEGGSQPPGRLPEEKVPAGRVGLHGTERFDKWSLEWKGPWPVLGG